MILKINRIKFNNIREFDNLELMFGDIDPYHVTMIQMANGTGKTTTLDLLRCIFSGDSLTSQEIREFKPVKFEATNGSVEVVLSVNDEKYTIKLFLDYLSEEFMYHTTSVSNRGHTQGVKLPPGCKFTCDFTKLFIFNGELAEDLLAEGRHTAESAIDLLYGLREVAILRDNSLQTGVEEFEKSGSTVTVDQGLKAQETQLRKFYSAESKLKEEEKDLEDSIIQDTAEMEKLEKRLKDMADASMHARLEEITTSQTKFIDSVKSKTLELLMSFRSPKNLSPLVFGSMEKLYVNMDILKLPRATASGFFEELCQSENCICGTKLNDCMKNTISENSKKYLSEDLHGIMNSVKGTIRDLKDQPPFNYANIKNSIDREVVALMGLDREKELLKLNLGGKDIVPEAIQLTRNISQISKRIEESEHALELIRDDVLNNDPLSNLNVCRDKIRKIEEKLSVANSAISFRHKSRELSKMFKEIHELSMLKLKKRIIENTNKKLKQISGSEVLVDSIDGCIKLIGKGGASEGQQLSVGYTYLTSLFEDSDFKLPFIIDSPCGSLDLKNRREISKMIPRLFEQVILFITSSERQDFADILLRGNKTHQYTIWKSKGARWIEVSDDLEFFKNHQIQDEEANTEEHNVI